MSKSASGFVLVLTVICLSVLMSLEADAQSTTDETNSCRASSLDEVVNLMERIASVQQENAQKMENIAVSQQENANEIKKIAPVHQEMKEQQQENAGKLEKIALKQQEIKEQLVGNSSALEKIANEVERIASNQEEIAKQMNASKSCECEEAEPSKQIFVSALISEFVSFHSTHITTLGQSLSDDSAAFDLAKPVSD